MKSTGWGTRIRTSTNGVRVPYEPLILKRNFPNLGTNRLKSVNGLRSVFQPLTGCPKRLDIGVVVVRIER